MGRAERLNPNSEYNKKRHPERIVEIKTKELTPEPPKRKIFIIELVKKAIRRARGL